MLKTNPGSVSLQIAVEASFSKLDALEGLALLLLSQS